MIVRTALSALLILSTAPAAFAGEEPFGNRVMAQEQQFRGPKPPPYFRDLPPPEIYRPGEPQIRLPRQLTLSVTCETRRNRCVLRRPQPIGSSCECYRPWSGSRPGVVR